MRTSQLPAGGGSSPICPPASSATSRAASGRRAQTVTVAPRSASATATARAAPPAPRMLARRPSAGLPAEAAWDLPAKAGSHADFSLLPAEAGRHKSEVLWLPPLGGRLVDSLAIRGAANPYTSVFAPIHLPSRTVSVLIAPTRRASGSSSSTAFIKCTLKGAVMLAPARPSDRANATKSGASFASSGRYTASMP